LPTVFEKVAAEIVLCSMLGADELNSISKKAGLRSREPHPPILLKKKH